MTPSVPVLIRSPWFRWLVTIDLLLMTPHLIGSAATHFGADVVVADIFKVTGDGSVPEYFNYLKWALISLIMIQMYSKTRTSLFASLSLVFTLILADDYLQLHENLGGWLATAFPAMGLAHVSGQDLGELLVLSVLGIGISASMVLGLMRTPRMDWGLAMPFAAAFAGLCVCAVGLDLIHAVVVAGGLNVFTSALGLAEDGGEMIAASLACAHALTLAKPSSLQAPHPGLGWMS